VPLPIQSGSITERLRKFFRIRGKTAFALDEIVAPVVVVQDLTKGPYQAGVTPAAGTQKLGVSDQARWSFAIILNDKPGSITPVLDAQFNARSFSFTWAEFQNIGLLAVDLTDLSLNLVPRSTVVAAGVPTNASSLVSIQNNNGSVKIPVEIFTFAAEITGTQIWRGILGDNLNTPGSRRTLEDIKPNITIGPEDALIFTSGQASSAGQEEFILMSVRGFYQEQPA